MTSSPTHPGEGPSRSVAAPSRTAPLRILIIGADPLFVESVTPNLESLGMVVIHPDATTGRNGEAGPGPDVVLVDVDGGGGDDTVPNLDRDMPDAKRLLMSAKLDHRGVRTAIQQGFRGAISKDIPLDRFGSAILSVTQGDLVVELESPRRYRGTEDRPDIDLVVARSLTRREREVLTFLVDGASGAEMAAGLSLSPHTVRTHVQNVMSKLQVHSRVEAVAYAVRHQIVQPNRTDRTEELV
jgi:two-component system, NarL family, nitrate/nitrite response regulator NarL